MKTPSETLHKLVRSLNQSEKRYFNLFTRFLHGGEDGLAYFDLVQHIDRQEKYNEEELKKNTGISRAANFKRLKHYATEALQRSLENFHAYSHADVIILRELARAEILYQKKQFRLVLKCIEKAEELATERNRLVYLLACLEWKLRMGNAYLPYSKKAQAISPAEIGRLTGDYQRWMELRRYNVLSFSMMIEKKPGILHKRKKEIMDMARHVNRIMAKDRNGYTLSMEGYMTLSSCYRLVGDRKKSFDYRKKLVDVVEADKKILFYRAGEYIAVIGNLMNAHIEMRNPAEVLKCYKKAESFYTGLPARHRNERVEERFINTTNNFISFLYDTGRDKEVLSYGETVFAGLKKHSFVFQNRLDISLFRHFAYSAFRLKQYRDSLKHFNTLSDRFSAPEIPLLLFGLLLYYEMGDRELLFHKARSFNYYLTKTKNKDAFFRIMGKAFAGYLGATGKKAEEQEAFSRLLKELKTARISLDSLTDIEEFNFLGWIKEKAGL